MKEAIEFAISLVLILGAGAAGVKTLIKIEAVAKTRIQKGLPPLSPFTQRLTCLDFKERTGDFESSPRGHCKKAIRTMKGQ